MAKYGNIAFITTPNFRDSRKPEFENFVYSHLYELCDLFSVLTTGRTGESIQEILQRSPTNEEREKIRSSMAINDLSDYDLDRWRRTIEQALTVTMSRFQGMIHVTYELVEGRLDAVIHLTDWDDKSAKPDSAVLSREANVHNVPIASDPPTALAYLRTWKRRVAGNPTEPIFLSRQQPDPPPFSGLSTKHRILAMIAHDNMKLETCLFAVEHAKYIFRQYDYILATGTTGSWLRRFMHAAGAISPADVEKVRCCNSGPKGGDIQIAYAVVKGLCQKIVFFQDPTVSHPHDSDIRLFEQAAVAQDVRVELATNVESAKLLVGV